MLFLWVAAADPVRSCNGYGVPALSWQARRQRAGQILSCHRSLAGRPSSINRDFLLIPAYVLTIGLWCAYGALRARRYPTRQALYGMVPIVFVAGFLDVAENVIRMSSVFPVTHSPQACRHGTRVALGLSLTGGSCLGVTAVAALTRAVGDDRQGREDGCGDRAAFRRSSDLYT